MIRMKRKTILGNVVQIPTDMAIAVVLSLRKEGNIKINHGTEYYFLKIRFQVGVTPVESEILLARGIDGYGYAKEINKPLFTKLHEEGLPEKVRAQLSNFLMDQYDSEQIEEENVIKKLEELLGIDKRLK